MTATIHLQGIGLHSAKPAGEVKVGDILVWNFGGLSVVDAIVGETAKMVAIEMTGNGRKWTKKMLKTRLVADKSMRPRLG